MKQRSDQKLISRWLELILLGAERAWAYAHEIKQEIAKDGYVHTNKRRHTLRRFAKARKHAQQLAEVSLHACDARTQVEVAAYLDWITALDLFERDRQVELAIGHFSRAQRAIQVLSVFGSPAAQNACGEKLSEIDSILRLCLHKAAQLRGCDTVSSDMCALPQDEGIDGRIAALVQSAPSAAQATTAMFEWHGERTKIQDEKVAELLASVGTHQGTEADAMDTDEEGSSAIQAEIVRYTASMGALTSAQKLLADELEASSSGSGSVLDLDSLVALHSAVTGSLAEAVIHRFTMQVCAWMSRHSKKCACLSNVAYVFMK